MSEELPRSVVVGWVCDADADLGMARLQVMFITDPHQPLDQPHLTPQLLFQAKQVQQLAQTIADCLAALQSGKRPPGQKRPN